MSREAMSEEERRRRRNEASRRCYLKRKAELAGQAEPAGAKNKKRDPKPAAKVVEAKPAKPAQRVQSPLVAAEKLSRRFAKVAAGIKPMLREVADLIGVVYRAEDQRTVEKAERILSKNLGVAFSRMADDPAEKTRVCVGAASRTVKTPAFRLTAQPENKLAAEAQPEEPAAEAQPEEPVDEPAELPVDPDLLAKVEAGEADKSEIDVQPNKGEDEGAEEDDAEQEDEDEEVDEEADEEEDDEDDEDDESEEAQERRARRREREESNNVREYESGRWEMLGEMGAQGAFDD